MARTIFYDQTDEGKTYKDLGLHLLNQDVNQDGGANPRDAFQINSPKISGLVSKLE